MLYHPRVMPPVRLIPAATIVALILALACDRKTPTPATTRPAARPTVASLVPAATDLLIAMDAADHLVAVSNYDLSLQPTRHLPRVGDYQTFDWEQLASIRPDIMIVFMTPDRMPPGLKQRADQLNIRLVNIRTERLSDILNETTNLGRLVNEDAKAARQIDRLLAQVAAAAQHAAGKPKVRTLLVRETNAQAVVGRDNFLNDILEAAGGQNVITAPGWPSIDRETLLALDPDAIIQLLPEASDPVVADARRAWSTMPQLSAVKNNNVHILTDWYVQNSGSHVGDLALRFAALLHPASTTRKAAP